MTESKTVTRLFADLQDEADPDDQATILSLLYTRIAAGLEAQEPGREKIEVSDPSEVWERANHYLLEIIKHNPEKGFALGVTLATLPEHPDCEPMVSWLRGNGLFVLGQEQYKKMLGEYLEIGEKADEMFHALQQAMHRDISMVRSAADASQHPEGFAAVQAIYTVLGLREILNPWAQLLYEDAITLKYDPQLAPTIALYTSFPDCHYLAERLVPAQPG